MNRMKIFALIVPILALAGGCAGGGGGGAACIAAAGAIGIAACPAGTCGGGGGAVGVGVVTPVAQADAVSTTESNAITLNVTGNDSSGTGDTTVVAAGATILAAAQSISPTNGIAVITDAAGGLVTYTPNAGFTGTDTFSYTLQDSNGATATALVTVTVAGGLNPIASTATLQGLSQPASFTTTTAILAGLPSESALVVRGSVDSRITIGPLADPSIDWDLMLGAGGGINQDIIASYFGGFEGFDGTMNYWEINLDAAEVAHGSLGPVLNPPGHPHAPFDADDPATPLFDESDPANFAAQSFHFTRLGLLVPGPIGSGLSFASYGIWEIDGPNLFGTSYVGSAFSFGVLTPPTSVPAAGSATYAGTMHGLFTPRLVERP